MPRFRLARAQTSACRRRRRGGPPANHKLDRRALATDARHLGRNGMSSKPMPPWLYRGVSLTIHHKNEGLIAKSTSAFEHCFRWGEQGVKYGDGHTWGSSVPNAVVRHQLNQAGYPTSGISTTPHFERATFYALSACKEPGGIVYKIDVASLDPNLVQVFRVADFVPRPSIPEDDEFILVARPGESIPGAIIVETIPVVSA